MAGISGRFAVSPNSQAIRITKAGLRNSDGWMLTPRMTSQRRAPLISAPKCGVAAVSTRLTIKTTSATLRISRGDRNEVPISTAPAGMQKQHLAIDEMKRVEPDAGRDRRTRGEAQHDAAEHQRDQRRQGAGGRPSTTIRKTAWVARAKPSASRSEVPATNPQPSGDTGMVSKRLREAIKTGRLRLGRDTRQRAHQVAERVAAHFEIAILVERGAGRRQQHDRFMRARRLARRARRRPPPCRACR